MTSLTRRTWLGVATTGLSGWLQRLAAAGGPRKRSCILLWMNGGPSTIDLWDLKPGQKNGGPSKEIATAAPGVRISENLPNLAKHAKRMAIVRSMSTKEADHGRATYLLRTGRAPGGPIQYPTLGSLVSKELARTDAELPGFVSIAPARFLSAAAFSSGFLGPRFAPLVVGENGAFGPPTGDAGRSLRVEDLDRAAHLDAMKHGERLGLWDDLQKDFLASRSGAATASHKEAYTRAVTMMNSSAVKAFDLGEEKAAVRDAYGRDLFGQGCLLARRLVERGVPFVEVNLNGWDTHQNNFDQVKRLAGSLDSGWAALMTDLAERGLLDTTTVVCMGEFGRTPKINASNGRDHWASSWSAVLAGGGVKGGQVIGKTSADGMEVTDRPVSTPDFLATVGRALGLDVEKTNPSNVGRPIRFVDPGAKAIEEVIA